MLCIQELSPFGYTPLAIFLRHFPLSSCVCVLKYLVFFFKKKKKPFIIYYRFNTFWERGDIEV